MHFLTVIAFVFLFWRAETPPGWYLLGPGTALPTLAAVLGLPASLAFIGLWMSRRVIRRLHGGGQAAHDAQFFCHRATFCLRLALGAGFGFLVLATPWPDWFQLPGYGSAFQILGDILVLAPYFAGAIAIWISTFPIEREIRAEADNPPNGPTAKPMRLAPYLDLNLRHQLLIVAVPMFIILWVANIVRAFEDELARTLRSPWGPDILLGACAALVFLVSPALLRHIWRTEPLEPGPVRERLEDLCRRIDMRFRDILVWKSGGTMINAAVMGIVAPFRFVMLSDALLTSMDPRQVEAVFGHEAGHVRHRHIQCFLGLAFVGWIVVAGLMELAARVTERAADAPVLSAGVIQGVGVVATVAFWAVVFGWVSRRFERQADLFGARCAAPQGSECKVPCSVHLDSEHVVEDGLRVCSTGARVFASALDRVAALNGIPRDEPSWRHSSIGSRMRFLASVAGDPGLAGRFERRVRRTQHVIAAACLIGAIACVWYWAVVPEPAVLRLGRTARVETKALRDR